MPHTRNSEILHCLSGCKLILVNTLFHSVKSSRENDNGRVIQHREHCSWSSCIQRVLVIIHIGEELSAQPKSDNVFVKFAVAVLKDNIIMGHIPREISRICWCFLQKKQSSIVCTITYHRSLSDVEGPAPPQNAEGARQSTK